MSTRILHERWPGLVTIPHIALADLPTPVQNLEKLSHTVGASLSVKRDDKSSLRYGGNKVRKLEFLLGEARAKGADTVITMGALGSHHSLATALFGTANGFDVHLMLGPQPRTDHVLENVRADLSAGATIHAVPSFALFPAAVLALRARLRVQGRRVVVIPAGGSSPTGALGYVEAGLELAAQIDRQEIPEPSAIYVALGTGSTVAGLAIGLAAAGVQASVVGVRVTIAAMSNRAIVAKLIRETVALLRSHDPRFPDVVEGALANLRIDSREYGDGYGLPTKAATHATELARGDNLELETTYTAKAFAAMLRDAEHLGKNARLHYVHTLSSASIDDLLAQTQTLPERLIRLVKR